MLPRLLSVALLLLGFWCLGHQETARSQWLLGVGKTPASACVLPTFSGALVAHWTADTGVTQSGGFVSAWADTTASIALSQATGANQPKFLATGYNSKPALQLNGSGGAGFNSSMMQTTASAVSVGANSTWFLVGQLLTNTDATGFGRLLAYQGSADANDGSAHSIISFMRNGIANSFSPDIGGAQGPVISLSLSTNYRLGETYDGTTATPYINNVSQSTQSATAAIAAAGRVGIGANLPQSGANVWVDAIEREILVYNAVLNGTQLNTVDTYLTCNNGT